MAVLDEVLASNRIYAENFGDKRDLATAPRRHFAILTCMDARMDPVKFAGLTEGDANVIRNAGGRASEDVIRSLVISYKLLGTREWLVIHHNECGLLTITNKSMAELLEKSLEPAKFGPNGWEDVGKGPGSPAGRDIDWLPFTDLEESVTEDVTLIRNHPLVPQNIPIYGFIYDVKTGKLNAVEEAMRAGRAK